MNLTIKNICEKIWYLEAKYDLLHKEIQGVKIWQLLRIQIYLEITQKTGVFGQAHTVLNKLSDRLKAVTSYLYNSIIKHPLTGNYRKKHLIFDHPRKRNVNNKYIDIYTNYFINSLPQDDLLVLEQPYLHQHFTEANENRKYMDYLYFYIFINSKLSRTRLSQQEQLFIRTLEMEITQIFGINLNLQQKFLIAIKRYQIEYKQYERLLQRIQPEKLYLVVSYGKGALIAAAKQRKIPVIEIQHGTMSHYHLGYSFPNGERDLDYFPDYLYSFGDYWADSVKLPIAKGKIIAYGFPYFEQMQQQYKDIAKEKRQLLFLSQGVIGKELAKFAYLAALELSDYKIIYKLHPGEYDRWRAEYAELKVAQQLANFVIIDNDEVNLYQYLAESSYQIGVFSTAIYEGFAFQCKTILVDLPGIEYMSYLIEGNFAQKVSNIEQLRQVLANNQCKDIDRDYFFARS